MAKAIIGDTAVARVARVFGGFAALGAAIPPEYGGPVSRSTVCNWNRPKDRHNGRGGSIPDKYHPGILQVAAERNLPISKDMLING